MHSMLLALRPDKFASSLSKKTLVAWTSCTNEPRATSRWKKCTDSKMKSDKLDRSTTSAKETARSTHTSQIKGTSHTSADLSHKGLGTSVTHP